jgi:hypothetical protein
VVIDPKYIDLKTTRSGGEGHLQQLQGHQEAVTGTVQGGGGGRAGVPGHIFCANVLLNLYVKLDPLATTCRLFVGMLERNMVSFVMLVQGYSTHADMYRA